MITLISPKDIITSVPEPLYAQYEKHNGKGTWKELYDWAIEYAEAGYAPAQESLGRYFLFCNSSIDYKQAVVWLKRSAEQGFAPGQFNLGWCYQKGNGINQDFVEAVKWYRKAAEQGHLNAQNNLGWCYEEGKGVEQNYEEAVNWYRKAAELGLDAAQCNLGGCYREGKGVDKDYTEAVVWYHKAAEQGHTLAQNNLGWCYKEGKGVEQNYEEAVNWYSKAADKGDPTAQYNLGLCFEEGKGIPNASFRVAVKWYTKAAEQNYTKALIALGTCYQECKGVQKDYVKAMELFEEALVLGDGNAKAKIDCLNDQIDAERKAKEEAERKAKEEAERKAKEEAERKAKEETERRAKEETERKAKEEAERKAKEEAERIAQEESERKAKEESELIEFLKPKVEEDIKKACDDFVFVEGGTYLSYLKGYGIPTRVEDFWIMKNPISFEMKKRLLLCDPYALESLSVFIKRFSYIAGINVEIPQMEQLEYVLRGGTQSFVENKINNRGIINYTASCEHVRKEEELKYLQANGNGLQIMDERSWQGSDFRFICHVSEYNKYIEIKKFTDYMRKGYDAENIHNFDIMEENFRMAHELRPDDIEARQKHEEAQKKRDEQRELRAKEEADRKAKEEAEQKVKVEAERKAKEEAKRKTKEESERKAKEEAELVELLRPKVSENIKSACEDFVFVEGGTYLSYLNGTAVQKNVEGFWIMKNPISKSLEKQLLLQEYTLDELRMFGNRFSSISGIIFELPTIEQLEYALRGGVNSTVENKLTNSVINNRFNNGSLFEVVRKDENVTNLTSGRDGLKEAINYRHNPNLNDRFFRLVCSMSEYDKYKQFKDLMEKGYNAELKTDYERMEKYFNFALKINPNDLTAKKKLEKALRKQAEESIENKAKEEAIRMEMERKCQKDAERKAKEEAERKAKEEAERKTKEEVGRKTQEEAENRLAEYRRLREANDDEFKTFCKNLLAKRAKAKSVGMLWKKSEEFEILTTPLTHNIFNSFRTGVVCTKSENETLMDQFKDKKDIALLIEKMENAYKDEGVTFTIPSSREIVGAQSAKVVGKEGVYLVCHFPEFEE